MINAIHSHYPPTNASQVVKINQGPLGSSPSSRIPCAINTSGCGRFPIFCSRLSARICFSSSRACAWRAGAAVVEGRMFPASLLAQVQVYIDCAVSGDKTCRHVCMHACKWSYRVWDIRSINSSFSGLCARCRWRLSEVLRRWRLCWGLASLHYIQLYQHPRTNI